jgi:peroxiredoxin
MSFRESIPPKLVVISGGTLLFLLNCLFPVLPHLRDVSALAAGEWLLEHERIEVNLTGTFYDVEGNKIDFDRYRDEVLMLNFWATWCPPCLIEMPSMAALSEEFQDRGLHVVAISNEDEVTIGHFVKQNPYPFTFLIDRGGKLTERLGVWALPLTIIIDRNGKLTYFHQGAQLWDTPDLKERIRQLIKE